ncbi:MAG TPA: M67 family peptidase [Desulfobacterales bacterium]|nr:M67 family peptidase [Desulfobacterales bacterium]
MILQIEEQILTAILEHGRREEPNEACGYLAARDGVIKRHIELTNIDAAPEHYSMDPAEQFAAIRQIREEGLQLAAVYHTHPESPARPSVEDIRLAHDSQIIYVIASLMAGVEPVRAFKIKDGEVTVVPLQVLAAHE